MRVELIHVMMFLHDLAPFGAQRTAINIAKYMQREAIKISFCSFWGDETLYDPLTDFGFPVYLLKARRLWDPVAYSQLIKLLVQQKVGVLHTHVIEMAIIGRLVKRLAQVPVIIHTLNNPITTEPAHLQKLENWTASASNEIVCVSESVKRLLPGYVKKRIGHSYPVIHNAIDIVNDEEYKGDNGNIRQSLDIPRDALLIGFTARLSQQKGHETLLQMLRLLIDREIPIFLVLLGSGELETQLKGMAESLSIDRNVRWMGYQRDVFPFLLSMDIYVSSSRWEGLPFSMLEAMSVRLPVVATDVSGNRELVKPAKNGILVPPDDPIAIADAVEYLWKRPEMRREIGENG